MKIVLEIGHPAHVHQFKNLIWELEGRGHEIKICTTNKDITLELLEAYDFEYSVIGSNNSKKIKDKAILLINSEIKLMRLCKAFKPDLFISRLSPASAHVSRIQRRPHIAFSDDDLKTLSDFIAIPFTDIICTPEYFINIDFGKKHIRYKGYKELGYLHPNYFTPDSSVLDDLGLDKNDKFVLIRFVSWGALHDYRRHGIENKLDMVEALENEAQVFITSEGKLIKPLEKYKVNIPPERIHDILYYATIFIGDSQTMTTEAATLGTPAIRCNSFVGKGDMGNFIELEKKYDLIFNFDDPKKATEKAIHMLSMPKIKDEWKMKKEKLLRDKVDVTAFMVWLIENYPESCVKLKEDPTIHKHNEILNV